MDPELREKIKFELLGTCESVGHYIDRLNLDLSDDDLEDEMLTANIETCPHCGWWMESGDLLDDDGNVVGCDQCRDDDEA